MFDDEIHINTQSMFVRFPILLSNKLFIEICDKQVEVNGMVLDISECKSMVDFITVRFFGYNNIAFLSY